MSGIGGVARPAVNEHTRLDLEGGIGESLGEDICKHVLGGDVLEINFAMLNALSNEVMTNVDMLHSRVQDQVMRQGNAALVIGVNNCS